MNRRFLICLPLILLNILFLCFAAGCTGYVNSLREESTISPKANDDENEAFLKIKEKEGLKDDVVNEHIFYAVKAYYDAPKDNEIKAKKVDSFIHKKGGPTIYIIPKYAGISITVEGMAYDNNHKKYVSAGVLYQTVSTQDYALMLQTEFPEAGPKLRISITYGDYTDYYEPMYDSKDDEEYPFARYASIIFKANGTLKQPTIETIPIILPNTTQIADFQKPDYLHYTISNMVYDPINETYAILYAVSNYDGKRSWQTYQGDNSSLQIQLFDKRGQFIKRISTDFDPVTNSNSNIIPSKPCIYKNGMLTFFSGWMTYVFFDTNTERYTSVLAERCTVDRDYFMISDGGIKEGSRSDVFTFSLYHTDEFMASIDVTIEDMSFLMSEGQRDEDETSDVFSLDSEKKTAIVANDKLTYSLDFNTKTWMMERHYNQSHLEDLIATSPDGRWEIYLADTGGVGDGHWADIVSLDTQSGKITYLIDYYSRSVAFGANNQLLVNEDDRLVLIDVENAKVLDDNFGIDCIANDCFINGVAFDRTKGWYLVVWRSPKHGIDNDREQRLSVILDIYDSNGVLIKSLDTGCLVRPFRKNSIIGLTLEIDGNGSVTISDLHEILGTVQYY